MATGERTNGVTEILARASELAEATKRILADSARIIEESRHTVDRSRELSASFQQRTED